MDGNMTESIERFTTDDLADVMAALVAGSDATVDQLEAVDKAIQNVLTDSDADAGRLDMLQKIVSRAQSTRNAVKILGLEKKVDEKTEF
jgi:hypothetical protein